ncbi:transcriptional regulator NrdR [Maledivibacter halophilus]|uniref:Transcriptional repressor NrdR n=1 Tax=Maledivibacter halophilus TaxID=36842 RepID=A0A1T5MGI4_9FIRM|nr:transcriptional regulator NrdR [Maledivibacter halophilus]SKC87361.1 transcriptional repressor NrdR [Maledivibacter halophilus]
MNCPYCSHYETKVVDSRPTDEGQAIRRRRECLNCKKRFTTYEKVEEIPIVIVKKDGNRQSFNRNKVINGMIRACEKRPVSMQLIEKTADEIERHLNNSMEKEIPSEYIGELVMNSLKEIDDVAYVRFASVYRHFKDINTFMDELNKLLKERK